MDLASGLRIQAAEGTNIHVFGWIHVSAERAATRADGTHAIEWKPCGASPRDTNVGGTPPMATGKQLENPNGWPSDLARAVRRRRRELGLTQIQLSDLAGCGPVFIYDLEGGR